MKQFDLTSFTKLKELEIGYVDLNNLRIIEDLFIKIKQGNLQKLTISSFT